MGNWQGYEGRIGSQSAPVQNQTTFTLPNCTPIAHYSLILPVIGLRPWVRLSSEFMIEAKFKSGRTHLISPTQLCFNPSISSSL